MEIKANEIKIVDIDLLTENPKNNNKHPREQIERLVKLIKAYGFRNPITVSNRSGFIVCGHVRLEAAKLAGMKELPVIYQDFKNEAEEHQHMTADNAIALWAELDLSMIKVEIAEYGKDFDLDLLGIEDFTLDLKEFEEKNGSGDGSSSGSGSSNEDNPTNYTTKIASPVYTPKKDTPPLLSELFTLEKYESLVKEIKDKKLPREIELFLISAASRHIVFNYENIAEFYCHQSNSIQDLMEKSALVIIDFNKAIENGLVKLTEDIQAIIDQNNGDVDDE